jgi:hypothetical protein
VKNRIFLMAPNRPIRVALVLAVALGALGSVAHAGSFDKYARKAVVDLGQSPYLRPSAHSRILLSCFYYPSFMVKELDDPGLKGTPWVTISPIRSGASHTCKRSHGSTERFIAKGWWGFIGVKGQLLFLEAPDGIDDGMPIRVLDLKTGRKIFEDSVLLADFRIDFESAPDGRMQMKYVRVVRGDCSIPKGGETCWNRFLQQFGLMSALEPVCVGYNGEPIPADEEQTESTIAYPVVVRLFPRPSVEAVPGLIKCRPAE